MGISAHSLLSPSPPRAALGRRDPSAIAIRLPSGEELREPHIHERAYLLVVGGEIEIARDGSGVTGGTGFRSHFEPNERRTVRALTDARLVLGSRSPAGQGGPVGRSGPKSCSSARSPASPLARSGAAFRPAAPAFAPAWRRSGGPARARAVAPGDPRFAAARIKLGWAVGRRPARARSASSTRSPPRPMRPRSSPAAASSSARTTHWAWPGDWARRPSSAPSSSIPLPASSAATAFRSSAPRAAIATGRRPWPSRACA